MIHLGLIGYPLGHSFSPIIHTAALKAGGFEGDYLPFPIRPNNELGLNDLLDRGRAGEIIGLNVTIPHKQNVIPLMDELTTTAKAIGAVNTIYVRDEKLIGDNTDAPAFLSDLKKFIEHRKSGIEKSVLVFGAGGSARAVVYALTNDDWNITIAARRIEQAQQLADSIPNSRLRVTNFTDLRFSDLGLIVNTTPLGMNPNVDKSPLPENLSLPQHVAVYDLVYNPRETKLVRDAHAQGLQAITGLGMLIEQAALSFERWTGHTPSREIMHAAIEQFSTL